MENYDWPVLNQAYRPPKIREKLLVSEAHHAWITSELTGRDQSDALLKTYPKGLLETLTFGIIQKEAGEFTGLGDRYDVPPVWARDGTRVGGYEKLNQIAESPTGYKKLNALISGMPNGTCQSYLRGWKHWTQYCSLRGYEPWVEVGGPGWGEMLLDFAMCENSVLCSKPPTTAGKI